MDAERVREGAGGQCKRMEEYLGVGQNQKGRKRPGEGNGRIVRGNGWHGRKRNDPGEGQQHVEQGMERKGREAIRKRGVHG